MEAEHWKMSKIFFFYFICGFLGVQAVAILYLSNIARSIWPAIHRVFGNALNQMKE